MNNDIVIGWHFLAEDGTSHNGYHPAPVGEWEPVIENPVLCQRGYHGSLRLIDALKYAPGPILQRCEYRGVVFGDDKFVATTRRAIVRADASAVIRMFAAHVAEEAITRSNWRDARSWAATQAARMHALCLISDADLAATRLAAWSATRLAARLAARSAAESAAWSAARSAAWSAAWSAAESAAWSAAESAARSAAESAQNAWLEAAILDLPDEP